VSWFSNRLLPVEQGEFTHWRSIYNLLHVVQSAEQGEVHKYVAEELIARHNEMSGTKVCYEEVRDLDSTYVFAGAGEWVVYTDNRERLIMGDHDDPEDAFYQAADDVLWVVVWMPDTDIAVVYRSPWTGKRQIQSDKHYLSLGMERGHTPSYTLPPEVEGSIVQDLNPDYPVTDELSYVEGLIPEPQPKPQQTFWRQQCR
tara:strand:- start:530 stop:1129 length:600 start_codon:yes stop_codon:yes gene_type:complete